MKEIYICRICGYNNFPDNFWTENGEPLYLICPSCNSESGYEDCNIKSIIINRNKWLEKTNYNFKNQLDNLEDKWKNLE